MNFKHGQTQLKHLKCINTVVFYWVISHEKLCKRNLQTDLCDNEILVINVIAVLTSNLTFSIKKTRINNLIRVFFTLFYIWQLNLQSI